MPGSPNILTRFWQELKRRKVIRVITVYAAAAFVILELVSIIADPLNLPEWTLPMIIVLLSIGFIIAVILSWIYDLHPDGGIVKTPADQKERKEAVSANSSGWKIASYISFLVIVALVILHIIPSNDRADEAGIPEKSIAVLPFENMSDDSEFAHLGDALTDEIIMQLYKIHEFEVRSRTSIMQYKETSKGSPAIGRELNVTYLLEGTAQRYGDQVRIRVQLIQASSDDHIWGEVYEGAWEDIFDIQVNVAKQVAGELKTVLSPGELDRIETKSTENIEAYNLYLQGRYFQRLGGSENLDKSIECHKQAIEIDLGFALAYAGLASSYSAYATTGYARRHDFMPLAKAAALKALELDAQLEEAHNALAWISVAYEWEWEDGEKSFLRAIELNPNYADARGGYAFLLSMLGRHEKAIAQYKRAHELDPLSWDLWNGYARIYYNARDYDRAIEEYQKIQEMFPSSKVYTHYALSLAQKGLHDEAIAHYSGHEFGKNTFWELAYIYGLAGEREKAEELLDIYLEIAQKEFVWPSSIAIIYAGMEETDKAMEWLEKTYNQQEGWLPLLQTEPMFDNLRSDPRFQDLLERMNFPEP